MKRAPILHVINAKNIALAALLAVLMTTGCATFSKLKDGTSEVSKLGPNEYEIYYIGGVFHNRKTLWQKWDETAAKVCNGKYEVIERMYENNIHGSDNVNGRIRCGHASPSTNTATSPVPAVKQETASKPASVETEPSSQSMTVLQIQQRLSELGYNPGPADGIMGKHTVKALKAFQQKNGLSRTGHADSETIAKLRQENKGETRQPRSLSAAPAEKPKKSAPIQVSSPTDL